jgi:aryl-alcohol dehydrogenase-like predicted oxidoreductase
VQSPAEALTALGDPDVEQLQLPFNLLDHRWGRSGVIAALQARPEVTVHVRSVLLQGLLSGDPNAQWPRLPDFSPARLLRTMRLLADRHQRRDWVDLSLAYVRAQDWIDGIVIGMESLDQLKANLALFTRPPLLREAAAAIGTALPRVPDVLLDPGQWPAARMTIGTQAH